MTAVLVKPPAKAPRERFISTDLAFGSGVRSGVGSVVRSVVGSGPDDPQARRTRAGLAIPYSRAAPDKVEETRTRDTGRAGGAGGAAAAALASGLIERDLTVAFARAWPTRPGTRAARAGFDLRCGRIDGYMNDPDSELPDQEEVRR